MLKRILIIGSLSLALAGCLHTDENLFETNAGEMGLPEGNLSCISTAATPAGPYNARLELIPGTTLYDITKVVKADTKESSRTAFHRVAGDIFAGVEASEDGKGQFIIFFRIEKERVELLIQSPDTVRLAKSVGAALENFGDGGSKVAKSNPYSPPKLNGPKDAQMKFIKALADKDAFETIISCRRKAA